MNKTDESLKDLEMHLMLTQRKSGPFWLEIEVLKLTSKPYLKTQKHFFIDFRTKLGIVGLRASVDIFEKRNTSTHFGDAMLLQLFSGSVCVHMIGHSVFSTQ